MLLKDVMTREVEVIHPEATLREAAEMMDALDVGPLPACDGTRLVGMVTDRDLVVRAMAAGQDPNAGRVRDVMTPEVAYCFEDDDVRDAASLMADKQIRRLVVLNRDKDLVGIVSLGDLAVETGNDRMSGDVLQSVSEPARPNR